MKFKRMTSYAFRLVTAYAILSSGQVVSVCWLP